MSLATCWLTHRIQEIKGTSSKAPYLSVSMGAQGTGTCEERYKGHLQVP